MPDLEILPVTTRHQKRQFLDFPWQIYRGDRNWIPPIRTDQKERVGFAYHPFYDNAEGQTFLARRSGQPMGRILAVVNHAHNRRFNAADGFFGFFETADDPEVADGLLTAARDWLASRGMTTMRGPLNPSINYDLGLLIDGFDSPPCIMMTYNPPYYAGLIEKAGFIKLKDAFAFWGHAGMLEVLDKKVEFVAKNVVERFNITVRSMDRARFKEEVRLFLDVYNRALVGMWGFVPLSEGEVNHMAATLKYLIVPELTAIAEIDGKAVGAMLALPDYNPRIKKINGRLFPFGFFRLLWNRKAIMKVRAISTNVVPEYQAWGIGIALLTLLEKQVRVWGIDEAEFSWVLEDNHLSRTSLEHGGAILQKTYRIYQYGGVMKGSSPA
ncbi:MAG: N-acetyltransferase [Pirellulales bacterium]|nr:N-acetyltransferase [Pirellulales bacterium]